MRPASAKVAVRSCGQAGTTWISVTLASPSLPSPGSPHLAAAFRSERRGEAVGPLGLCQPTHYVSEGPMVPQHRRGTRASRVSTFLRPSQGGQEACLQHRAVKAPCTSASACHIGVLSSLPPHSRPEYPQPELCSTQPAWPAPEEGIMPALRAVVR